MSLADGPFSINIYATFLGGLYNKFTSVSHDMFFSLMFHYLHKRVIYRYILFVFCLALRDKRPSEV